ncbi:MAG: penicillin-binding protein activator LpoB [Planctomycetaceae bacterium]|nr:penicillin-binding protein activator LpoB [Planctomycetaceae bacterium]
MLRRHFLKSSVLLAMFPVLGCRGNQKATVMKDTDADTVASHEAGAETWKPLVEEAVSRLTGRQMQEIQLTSVDGLPCRKQICFVGVENRSSEEIGDFKEQIYEHIDTLLSQSEMYGSVSQRYVAAGLKESRLRPDDLFVPSNQQQFMVTMQQMNQPFDYLLFAKITSGTSVDNKQYQRDYLLTLELVDIHTGSYTKESASLRKKYRRSLI